MNRCKENEVNTAMKVLKVIGLVLLGAAACFLFGLAVMLLWNWLMPLIFGLPVLNYWQSVGIMALASILFGRFGGHSGEDKKERKTKKYPIRDSVREEIKKEFEKEFAKEKAGACKDYDEVYDEWWKNEGEGLFEKYMSSKENENS